MDKLTPYQAFSNEASGIGSQRGNKKQEADSEESAAEKQCNRKKEVRG